MKVDYRLDEHPVCPALYKRPGEGVPAWRCRCVRPDGRPLLRNKRHASEADCLPLAEVEAFQRAHPEIKTLSNARRMCWLAKNFAPIPDAEIPCYELAHGRLWPWLNLSDVQRQKIQVVADELSAHPPDAA